jgi:EAL domain-containing protein (putative c-di-GMP-specific phosphodiesterase class I)/CheY-like chemotaxis protein
MQISEMIDRILRCFGDQSSQSPPEASSSGLVDRGVGCDIFIVDDEPELRRMIVSALGQLQRSPKEFASANDLVTGLEVDEPKLIFLDVALDGSDAIDVIRQLGAAGYSGAVQLMSGRDTTLLTEIESVGKRHGLVMLPPLQKPFRLEAIRAVANGVGIDRKSAAPRRIDLQDALDRNWMELWYQPKIDLRTMKFSGAEGLARVRHPKHGVLSPASFLPKAGEEALIALTEWALVTAHRDWKSFTAADLVIKQAINVPVSALLKAPIAAILRAERPQDPRWPGIILEVTEDEFLRDVGLAHEAATQLRIYGATLAIDDFGAGYSSLARLKELPFAEIKLDRSFVTNCASDPTNKALCQAIVDLAHGFGSLAVAEGVETAADLRALHGMGCDLAQGYLLAKPMPRDELITVLKTRKLRQKAS